MRLVPEQLDEREADGSGYEEKVSTTECGAWPTWSGDGKKLYFRENCDGTLDRFWVVAIQGTQSGLNVGEPEFLFDRVFRGRYPGPSYSITSDGLFLLSRRAPRGETSPRYLNVVLNWFEELKQRVPTGRQ